MTIAFKNRVLEFFIWVVVFALYFGSELILRTYYIHGSGNSKEQLEAMAKKIPGVLKDSIQANNEAIEAHKKIDEALLTGDKDTIFTVCYAAGISLDDKDREMLYRNLLKDYPNDLNSLTAFISVMSETDPKYNLDTFFNFLNQFNKEEKVEKFCIGWSKISGYSNKSLERTIKYVIENQYVSDQMFSIYNDMISIRFKLNLPIELERDLEDLKDKCFDLYKKKQMELLRQKEKENKKGGK